jgi:hypothetical protein
MFDVMKLVRGTTGVKVCQPVIAYYALKVIILRGIINPAEAGCDPGREQRPFPHLGWEILFSI